MAPILYKHDLSPPSRAVLMTAELLGLTLDLRDLNPVTREQDVPDMVVKNPMRTIPILDDDGFCLADSHAIIVYLVEKYGRSQHESLFPREPHARATVLQRMFFDCGVLFERFRAVSKPTFMMKLGEMTPSMRRGIDDAYRTLEQYLSMTSHLAGNHVTVADICAVTSVAALHGLHDIDAIRYPKTLGWFTKMSSQEYCRRLNTPGNAELVSSLKSLMENTRERLASKL